MADKTIFKTKAKDATSVILGIQPDSKNVVIPLSDGPHFLVAGTTGSGKSVFINSALVSMMAHTHPDEIKLTIIDPKTVEFSNYKGLPYMLCDPLIDMSKANTFVQYLVEEMERRYDIFAEKGVKKLAEYQELTHEDDSLEKIPYIVLVIDEFADLISQFKDVEKPIARIGQKARAAGIHMIIATQSPRREVITGLIKANVPSRVSLMVANSTESQIILDETGGEKLRPRGDFLLKMNGGQVTRGQAPFVSNGEMDEIFEYLRETYETPEPVDFEAELQKMLAKKKGENPEDESADASADKFHGSGMRPKGASRKRQGISKDDKAVARKAMERIDKNKKEGKKGPTRHKVDGSMFTKAFREAKRREKGLDTQDGVAEDSSKVKMSSANSNKDPETKMETKKRIQSKQPKTEEKSNMNTNKQSNIPKSKSKTSTSKSKTSTSKSKTSTTKERRQTVPKTNQKATQPKKRPTSTTPKRRNNLMSQSHLPKHPNAKRPQTKRPQTKRPKR